jgi:hypothetical protein
MCGGQYLYGLRADTFWKNATNCWYRSTNVTFLEYYVWRYNLSQESGYLEKSFDTTYFI